MRPTFRSIRTATAALTLGVATWLAFATAAGAITLYSGTYATDLSSSAPGGLSPANPSSIAYPTAPIQLSWRNVPGTAKYQVQIARQSSDGADCAALSAFQSDNIVVSTTTSENQWVPTLDTPETGSDIWTGTYCWRVRTDGTTPGAWSAAHRFTRTWSSAPSGLRFYNDHDGSIPRTSASADFAKGSATTRNAGYLSWDPVPGAASYEVEVGTSQSFSSSSIYARRDGMRASRVLLLHLPDDTYYWRVRAIAPNGTEGGWSTGDNRFEVKWEDPSWSLPSNLYPQDNGLTDARNVTEFRIGWTPMPGASYYEYQIGTNGGCFWDPANPDAAPDEYGDWVNYPAHYYRPPDGGAPIFEYTQKPLPTQCRLSPVGATTINNWVTLQDALDDAVIANITQPCLDEQGAVQCEPATMPDDRPDDRPCSVWRGRKMAPTNSCPDGAGVVTEAGAEDGEAYQISWRVRPVYRLKPDTETGWDVTKETVIYGSWTKYTQGGANRQHRFDLHLYDGSGGADVPVDSVGTRCDNPSTNPTTDGCLKHRGSTMQANQAEGVAASGTMQMPLLSWRPFLGANGEAWAGGYIIQIARDPLFNNIAKVDYQPSVKAVGWGWQQSYAMTEGLSDNSEGTGYWWRVIPCQSLSPYVGAPFSEYTNCVPFYADGSIGLPKSEDPNGYDDMGVAQTFTKRTTMQTSISPSFEGSAPLIRWTVAGVAADDHAGWSRGVGGSEYYEVQLARDPFMAKELSTLKTTIPRIVPFKPGGEAGKTDELADGIWYYRVRAVDRNGLSGSWSDVQSFNKRIDAPTPAVSGGGNAGAGVTISWSAIAGATDYTVEWSSDSSFETGVGNATTRQTAFRMPSSAPGTFYWRVRANVGGIAGQWSAVGPTVTIYTPTEIRFALNRSLVNARSIVTVYGQLNIAGTPRNGKLLQLQRKSTGCDAGGAYSQVAQSYTGRAQDDGMATFRVMARQNGCYRLAWVGDQVVHYSAPIAVKARPVVMFRLLKRKVSRGKGFCTRIVANTPLTGRLRVQYKVGRIWVTARTANVRAMKARIQCASIFRSGNFPVRVTFDRMTPLRARWKQFENATASGGRLRVNDTWRIIR